MLSRTLHDETEVVSFRHAFSRTKARLLHVIHNRDMLSFAAKDNSNSHKKEKSGWCRQTIMVKLCSRLFSEKCFKFCPLCCLHSIGTPTILSCSQAAELLRTERKENHARVRYLTDRVKSLEKANRNSLEGLGDVPSEPSEG